MSKSQLPIRDAEELAGRLVSTLSPACDRIEVAGSVRRHEPVVGDIELVVIPSRSGLFAGVGRSMLDELLQDLVNARRLKHVKGGDLFKQFSLYAVGGIPVTLDVFIADVHTWGYKFAVHTGPKEFSKACVTERRRGGRLRNGLIIGRNRVWRSTDVITGMVDSRDYRGSFFEPMPGAVPFDTPEERDFLALAGGWYPPQERRPDLPLIDEDADAHAGDQRRSAEQRVAFMAAAGALAASQ